MLKLLRFVQQTQDIQGSTRRIEDAKLEAAPKPPSPQPGEAPAPKPMPVAPKPADAAPAPTN